MNTGIPTQYKNVNFRSRLEARWAAAMDILEWEWQYEPLDLPGWVPDFMVRCKEWSSRKWALVEVKPITTLKDAEPTLTEMQNSFIEADAAYKFNEIIAICGLGLMFEYWVRSSACRNEIHMPQWLWAEAGNRVQWKARVPWQKRGAA